MEGGISNKTVVRFFAESADNDIKKTSFLFFPSNFVNRFISLHDMISKSGVKYMFVIMNTDRNDKKGMHW